MAFEESTTLRADEASAPTERLRLFVLGEDGVRSLDLLPEQTIRIGRANTNDLVIADEQLSREHAMIETQPLRITDLGSANGVTVAGQRIVPDQPRALSPGVLIELGITLLVVQAVGAGERRRPLSTHTYLEARLEEEIRSRTGRSKAPFAVLTIRIDGACDGRTVESLLTEVLGPSDVIAAFAPNEYELLLLEAAPQRADAVADKLRSAFRDEGLRVDVGLASYPSDAVTAQALIASARASLRGQVWAEPDRPIIHDPAMKDLYRMVDRVARGQIAIMLRGETGVGKEVLAEAIHQASPRSQGPMVRLNCAAMSETLVESELFGHKKGAFTGADTDKKGLVEAADGGTLFLDEVGELPIGTQAKLLRVIEDGAVRRIGSIEGKQVDVRFVSATNRDLEQEVERGTFRQDLYYRLGGVTLRIPPLRERVLEIEPLTRGIITRISQELDVPSPQLSSEALSMLQSYQWPGNIRELRNVLERAVLLSDTGMIEPSHLPTEKLRGTWEVNTPRTPSQVIRPLSDRESEHRNRILEALDACAGNQTRAAEQLGVSRQTLSNWLNRYGIPRPRKR